MQNRFDTLMRSLAILEIKKRAEFVCVIGRFH